jgi:BASS family bile acid:Na+ symporter
VNWIRITIQILTCSALVGLLGAVGLRLPYREVRTALVRCRFTAILAVNFTVIPLVAIVAATGFGLKRETAVAMVLLAASPFAPVVPVFTRMARAELALAAALTGVFPLACVFLTPLVARAALWILGAQNAVQFNMWSGLAMLGATITLPLAAGVFVRHRAPDLGRLLLRPIEIISEAVGAASLAFVAVTQFGSILNLKWRAWLAMALVSEISLFLGWQLGGPDRGSRQVVAFGTANRNIALALLLAIQSFRGTTIASAVVGNGLLLIAFGLVHVAWWRLADAHRSHA